MKRMTYLCRIGRTSLGLPRQAKADMSIKTAQLPALCLLNQYGIKKLSTVSDNKSKKCLVKSGKDRKYLRETFYFHGDIFYYQADIFYYLLKKVYYKLCNGRYKLSNICYKLCNAYYKLCNKNYLIG